MSSDKEVFAGNYPRVSLAEFNKLSALVYQECGIKLPPAKKIMLESRLNKRLRALHMESYADYINYLTSVDGMRNELVHMIDEITTNKTDFFREPHHFDFFRDYVLSEFLSNAAQKKIQVWSAACSSGEEPYTLAMLLNDCALEHAGFDYSILASDISTDVLQKGVTAVYNLDRISGIPLAVKQKYFLKSKDTLKPTVRIIPELRAKVQFQRINLMDNVLPVEAVFDAVFCRNVLIYFDRPTQQEVLRKLCNKLKPAGYLFIGHSESLYQLDLPLRQVKPTIFQRI